MRTHLRRHVLLYAALLFLAGAASGAAQADQSLVDKGQMYVVVWSCAAPTGCFGELVRVVEKVRADGWVEVVSCTVTVNEDVRCFNDHRWRINLSNVLQLRRRTPGKAANE